MTTNANAVSIDDLLDGTLDDLKDAPAFKPFPKGVHKVKINWLVKTIGDMPAVELKVTLLEVVELAVELAEGEEPPKAGDETSCAFILKKKDKDTGAIVANELAQGQMKELIKSLGTDLNMEGSTNRQIMEATENMECMAVTNIRVDKRDKDNLKYYTSVEKLNVI